MSNNACTVYDFTDNNYNTQASIMSWCRKWCKKFCFVGEEGASSKHQHWQGRVSLKVKKRLVDIPNPLKFHFSITSNANKNNNFYIEKGDTAITEVYDDKIEELYIPRQIREIESLYPWQQEIIDDIHVWDKRYINLVYSPEGNIGKSTLQGWMRAYQLARVLPFANDYKDILRFVENLPTSRAYVIDMPRAIKKDRLDGFFAACETIKDGFAYDDRYHYKEKRFDCPNIWIFTNSLPDAEALSKDRWRIYKVVDNELTLIEKVFG